MFEVKVNTDGTERWDAAMKQFASIEEAKAYAIDLWQRWTLVRVWRVIDVATGNVVAEGQ